MSQGLAPLKQDAAALAGLREICARHQDNSSALIQIMLEIQEEYHWLSAGTLLWLSGHLQVPLGRLYEIGTFYKVFSLVPRGRNLIKICTGTACHVRKAPVLLNKVMQMLGINPGETTPDCRFTLETVGCLGCCALGPVLVINDEYCSNPTTAQLEKLFNACS